ncbi:MAG: hypothetical protein B6U72_04440 [Candidatus Altiarchaeales archaeon ex4484_2]|nr:MAG: hypothetical protein B6U72_04440 [Candidatus Altiarchaeales archaeon ex4484_2]
MMRKSVLVLLVAFIALVGVLGFGGSARAAIDLPWETTYDCPDWTQSDWINNYTQPDCNGIHSGVTGFVVAVRKNR